MTESVSSPRPRSRSSRSSSRSRQRSAAAAGSTSARATARPGNAPASDAPRDERTLDLFGDPVLEPGERAPVAARDEAVADAEAVAAADGRQATLDGFIAPEGATAAGHTAAEGAVPPEVVVAVEGVSTSVGGVAASVDGASVGGGDAKAADSPAVDGAAKAATTLQAADGAAAKLIESPAADAEVAKSAAEVAAVKSREGKSSGDAVKERRPSSGGKRRAGAGASEAAAMKSAPAATSVDAVPEAVESTGSPDVAAAPAEPQTPVQPAEPAMATNSEIPSEATAQSDVAPPLVTQPVASAASFVTKPSAERAQPAAPVFDPDTHLRPLTDRFAALQADVDGLQRTADREMRRVNRLLLALAVVVLAGLVALVLQTRQIAHLKQDAAAKQQRIDRLTADLSTQQATLMTLEEHHEALLSQVDRLQRTANREAAVAKRARRTR
ncbi:flagellar hook-length control protein FliK [Burkholderia cepacia]|uniref:flagellar hook-length control protein FliK n=1 Tax=Burkholderia cepacia TaxID=292 RepID=UPI00249D8CFC|nr:flagellar hook-length control protein FliK [Burkholderia cepacia]WGY70813.1 flagellar hook-length control protein FliK [Burkholderia cepacia]